MPRFTLFGRFSPYLRPYRIRMAASALLVMGTAGINLGMLWVIRRLVDTVFVPRAPAALNMAIAELGALFLCQGALGLGHRYLTASTRQRILAELAAHRLAPPSRVNVILTANEVHLWGAINDPKERQSVFDEVAAVEGAPRVVNHLGGR